MSGSWVRCYLCVAIAVGLACTTHAKANEAVQAAPDAVSDAEDGTKEQPAAATATPKDLAAVRVVGHYANGIRTSDAASEGVILGSLLQDVPLLRPGEVLEAVPGLVVTQHSGEGKANQYFLRGYNLDHGTDFATSVDGVPVNMPTNAHGQGYSDLNFLIPELVSSIDYRKGTYFAQNGDFSSAGSSDIHYRGSVDSGIADLTSGSYGYRRVLVADSFPLSLPGHSHADDSSTSASTLLAAVDGLENNGPDRKDPEDMRRINSVFRLSDGDSLSGWSADALAYEAHWNSTDQVPLALIQSGQLCRFCALDPTDGGDTARDILSGEWHQHDDDGYTKVSAYAEHYRLQLFSDFTFFELRPATGDQFEQEEARNIFGAQVVKGWLHTLFGFDSITEAGLQVRHDNIHVGLWNSEARIPFEVVNNNIVSETEAGLYVQNTTTWTPWFRSLVGLRGDDLQLGVDSLTNSENSAKTSQSRASPKLSLIFGPWDKTEFFVDIGSGFHSNDARGVIYKFDPTTGLPASPVPALVGSFGKELGLRTEIVHGLQSSLALWNLNSESELIYDADSAIGSTTPNGASKRHGVEWNNHYILNDWLFLDADLAWTHARYANENDNGQLGDFIPNAVPKVGSIGVTAHGIGKWSGDIKMLYIGRYPLSQDGTLVGPSAAVTNLRVQRELTPSTALSLDVLNLFDRKYYDIAYEQDFQVTPMSPAVPDGVTVHPGQPREFRATLRLKF
jgi:outer membrane receptor protein involved in Fe transport